MQKFLELVYSGGDLSLHLVDFVISIELLKINKTENESQVASRIKGKNNSYIEVLGIDFLVINLYSSLLLEKNTLISGRDGVK